MFNPNYIKGPNNNDGTNTNNSSNSFVNNSRQGKQP